MSTIDAGSILCGGCSRQFAWKPQLAGKRVKCKCGHTIAVGGGPGGEAAPVAVRRAVAAPPRPKPAAADEDGLGDLYALADDADRAAAVLPVEVRNVPVPVAAPVVRGRGTAKPGGRGQSVGGQPLAYQRGTTTKERQVADRHAAALVDPKRDYYVPSALIGVGFVLYLANYGYLLHLDGGGLAAASVGLTIMLAIKVALLVGFALVVSGPLGVGFGSVGTAVLKLAAVAVFTDGVTAWVATGVGKAAGGVGNPLFGYGMLAWPVALGLYWGLMVYLFGLDSGESWTVVVCLTVFDRLVRVVVLILLASLVSGLSGPSFGGGGGSPAAFAPATKNWSQQMAVQMDQWKDGLQLKEAKQFIADGHQAILTNSVNAWYADGCPKVWFQMSGRDINGKQSPESVVVELPPRTAANKAARAKCYATLAQYDVDAHIDADPNDLKDTGEDYIQVEIR